MLNTYGDQRIVTQGNFGVDIAIQRADDLDNLAIEKIKAAKIRNQYIVAALDIGGGQGGQAIRMAKAGATMAVVVDAQDYGSSIKKLAVQENIVGQVHFIKMDMRYIRKSKLDLLFWDVIVCQRAIHYLNYQDALRSVSCMRELLCNDGNLYLSASGMPSELSTGYTEGAKNVHHRYGPLSDEMRGKHGIHGNVCLYSSDDLASLLKEADMYVERIWVSEFGNIKAVAKKNG